MQSSFLRPVRQGRLSLGSLEGLLEIGNDVVDVLGTDRDADCVLGDTRVNTLLLRELLVRSGPGVDRESLGVTDTVT